MKPAIRDYLHTFSCQLLCLSFGMLSGIIAARFLQPEGRGEMAIIQYYPSLMATFLCMALPSALTLLISRDEERSHEFCAAGIKLALLLGVSGALLFAVIAPFTLLPKDQHLALPVALACLLAPPTVINPHLWAVYRGKKRFVWVNGMLVIVSATYLLILLLMGAFHCITPLNAVLASIAAQLLVLALSLWHLGTQTLFYPVQWITYRRSIIQGVKYFIPVLFLSIYKMADRPILMHSTTIEEIGYYIVAFGLTAPLIALVEPFVQVGFVELSSAPTSSISNNLFIRRFHMAQNISLLLFILSGITLYPIVHIFYGAIYCNAITTAYILIIVMSLSALSKILESNLRALNINSPIIISSLTSLVALVILGTFFTSEHGATGFSLAFLITEFSRLVLLIIFTCYHLSIHIIDLWGLRLTLARHLFDIITSYFHEKILARPRCP